MKTLLFIAILFLAANPSFAKTKKAVRAQKSTSESKTINMDQQFNNLGGNEEIIEKARALQPNNSMKIVQKRQVDRNNRFEFGASYGFVNGGDSYVNTSNIGASLDFHINPRWSIGARYIDHSNKLTSEGKRIFDQAAAQATATAPAIDYVENTAMAVINWYPIYGKVSWFESSVSQFDLYLIAGGGQTKLASGNSPIFTGGVGVGLWVNNWLTSRIEARYQNYKDRPISEERSINSFVLQFGIGIML